MIATRWVLVMSALAAFAASDPASASPGRVGAERVDALPCDTNCLEVIEEGGFTHVFHLDASGERTHLSTSLSTTEEVVLDSAKAVRLGLNLRRIPIESAFAEPPSRAESGKLAGCGVDGWGWEAGETMWSQNVSESTGPSGRTRTDARSVFTARGRGVLFTTTTTFPPSGAPTSTTQTSPIEALIRSGAMGCTRER